MAKKKPNPAPARFQLDHAPRVGEIVHYYQNGCRQEDPIVAVVVGPPKPRLDGRIDLVLIRKHARDIVTRESVLNHADPRLISHPRVAQSSGSWDFTSDGLFLRECESQIVSLTAQVKLLADIANATLPPNTSDIANATLPPNTNYGPAENP